MSRRRKGLAVVGVFVLGSALGYWYVSRHFLLGAVYDIPLFRPSTVVGSLTGRTISEPRTTRGWTVETAESDDVVIAFYEKAMPPGSRVPREKLTRPEELKAYFTVQTDKAFIGIAIRPTRKGVTVIEIHESVDD